MNTFLQDIRYAIRVLFKNPGFTIVTVIALGLGIGANTAIFSVVNTVLLRPLPYPDPDRLMMVWVDNRVEGIKEDINSYANYADLRDRNKSFQYLAGAQNATYSLTDIGEPEQIRGAQVTANFFQVMGINPFIGRPITVEEEEVGHDQVAVISYGLWQRRFGGDQFILSKKADLNGRLYDIVGVMPKDFEFPATANIWTPLSLTAQQKAARTSFFLPIIGRLKPGVPIAEARAEMIGIGAQLEKEFPNNAGYGVNPVPLHEQVVGKIRPALLILLGAVAFVLLIACANVANLLLARAASRQREFALRTALGASRGRVVRQLLTESVLLAAIGGVFGLLLASLGISALKALSPADIPRLDHLSIDGRVLVFTLLISMVTGMLFGLVPALQAARPDLNETLKEGGRSGSGGIHSGRVRNILVVSEIALSLMLLIGAGLLLRSFYRLQQVDPGLRPDGLLTMQITAPRAKYQGGQPVVDFYKRISERLATVPGVQSDGATSAIMLRQLANSAEFSVEGKVVDPNAPLPELPFDAITPTYFQTMGVPLIRGRWLTDADDANGNVAVINDTFARKYWTNEDPIGKRFKFGSASGNDGNPWISVVGVVRDVKRQGLDSEIRIQAFLPHTQAPSRAMDVAVRTSGDPIRLGQSVREAIWSVDKDIPITNLRTMNQILAQSVAQRRFNMMLLGLFAAVALVLAAVGIYGVMSYSVTQRTHEIGIRMALGAQRETVMKMVVGQGMILAGAGVGIGLLGAILLTRLMTGLLFGITATDPITFGGIVALLSLVAMVSCYLPARRATKVDPMVALRYE